MNKLEKISVVGGGTAGFVSALILKSRFPNLDIEVVRSKKIGIIGVGEGSTEHWDEFMKYIGVSFKTVLKHCDATFKSGIMFKGWAPDDFLHSTTADFEAKNGQYLYMYGRQIANGMPKRAMQPNRIWENKIFSDYLEGKDGPFNQYHFNTNKLNEFLTKVATLKGIKVIDDEILDVVLNERGEIDHLVGEAGSYKSDFYIDCTGFKKILISKLGAKWQSYGEYLKMKSALVFPTGDTEEYNMWTIAQTMDYGWMFRIPTWGRHGNGYIFDSDYITADKAKEEIDKWFGRDVDIGKQINFDPGALDRVWIKNCCAVGLSANFVEPLEATSIGTSIQQMFLLMHRIVNYDEKTIEKYNKDVGDILTNIRDFIILHYQTKKTNTDFWKDVSVAKIPDSLAENLEKWRKNLPIEEDFAGVTKYTLFKEGHHTHILNGLNLLDVEKISQEYFMMHPTLREVAEDAFREMATLEKMTPMVGHKEFIHRIRSS
jgi:tryptophan halogenase